MVFKKTPYMRQKKSPKIYKISPKKRSNEGSKAKY
jgi:hypothetical protein